MSFETLRDRNLQYQQSDGNGEHPVAKASILATRKTIRHLDQPFVIIPSRAVRRFTRVG